MNKTILSSIILIMPLCIFGQNWSGTWRVSPEAGALHVGPGDGSTWWASSLDDVTTRECYFDDEYVFNADGSFSNVLGTETWIEAWQGIAADACGAPVSPHDGSSAATYTYTDSTITLSGVGAYLGLPKVYNGGELGAANADSAIATRTYDIALSSGNDTMTVSISIGSGIWTYKLAAVPPVAGNWRVSPEAGALHVGPGDGSTWWANSLEDVTTRACYFDDEYVFDQEGFHNDLFDETWIEAWQGIAADGCGTPVYPHDGSNNPAGYTYTDSTVTLSGVGAYLGLPKAYNGGELGATNADSAIATRTYDIAFSSGNDTMTVSISIGSGIWTYKLVAVEPPPDWSGTWKVSPEAGALHVGPPDGSTWWANSLDDVTTRACYFDDEYVFNASGSFSNVLGTETWIEAWQGIAADACGSPVSPHDGSNAATYTYTASTVTLSGVGAYLGLPKAYNGGELGAANADSAIASRTYDIALSSGNDTMTVSISIGSGIWTYKLVAAQPSTGVISDIVPTEFSLANNYPNPFNPTTTISFSIPKQMDVGLNIYNVMGQLVANVAKGRLDAGTHNVQWNGRDHNGNVLPSGLYFYELVGGKQFRKVKKMTLVK